MKLTLKKAAALVGFPSADALRMFLKRNPEKAPPHVGQGKARRYLLQDLEQWPWKRVQKLKEEL